VPKPNGDARRKLRQNDDIARLRPGFSNARTKPSSVTKQRIAAPPRPNDGKRGGSGETLGVCFGDP